MNQVEQAALLKLKLQKLLSLNKQLQSDLEIERQQSATLLAQLQDLRKSEEIAEERNKISKLADGIRLNRMDEKEVKRTLNQYIQEIDECLKLLNQLSDNT